MTKSSRKGIPANDEKIKELRGQLGKTLEQLTKGAGVGLRTLVRAERGESISPGALQGVAYKLGVSVEEIQRDAN